MERDSGGSGLGLSICKGAGVLFYSFASLRASSASSSRTRASAASLPSRSASLASRSANLPSCSCWKVGISCPVSGSCQRRFPRSHRTWRFRTAL